MFLLAAATACSGGAPLAPPADGAGDGGPATPTRTATRTASATPTIPSATPTPTPTVTLTNTPTHTPTLAPDAWQSMPVVPASGGNARRIYGIGLGLGNDPHAFSILGDCLSLPYNLFGEMGKGPNHYKLGEFTYLQPAVEWFSESLKRRSVSLVNGFNTAAVLSPLRADPELCENDESPMVCEYRIHRPSYAIIALGTDDNTAAPEAYEERMRKIVDYTISKGIVPILATKADDREGNHAFNRIVANLAYEYGLPMWNFWAAVQPLPLHGLIDNRGHLSWADPDDFSNPAGMQRAVPVRSLTALQTLDSVWRGVTAP
jgi:hypothetical protein